jgi:structural maintenance of chromosome 4
MKPKAENENQEGMLEYLEDIIGSNRLKEPIHKLQNRLEKIDEQRATQLQRFNHAEKEKMTLEEPVSKVLSKMRLENAINTVRNRVLSFKRLFLLFYLIIICNLV